MVDSFTADISIYKRIREASLSHFTLYFQCRDLSLYEVLISNIVIFQSKKDFQCHFTSFTPVSAWNHNYQIMSFSNALNMMHIKVTFIVINSFYWNLFLFHNIFYTTIHSLACSRTLLFTYSLLLHLSTRRNIIIWESTKQLK